jgi:hypothetical protein
VKVFKRFCSSVVWKLWLIVTFLRCFQIALAWRNTWRLLVNTNMWQVLSDNLQKFTSKFNQVKFGLKFDVTCDWLTIVAVFTYMLMHFLVLLHSLTSPLIWLSQHFYFLDTHLARKLYWLYTKTNYFEFSSHSSLLIRTTVNSIITIIFNNWIIQTYIYERKLQNFTFI